MQTTHSLKRRIIIGAIALGGVAMPVVIPAGTLYVDAHNPTPPEPYEGFTNNWANAATNIQEAVNAAEAGDTILVRAGTYRLPDAAVDSAGALNVVHLPYALTIRGVDGPEVTLIDGEGQYRGIAIAGGAQKFEGLTVTNGFAPHGAGAVHGGGTYEFVDCTLTLHTGGGAIHFDGDAGTFVVYNSIIFGNVSANVGTIPSGWQPVTFVHNCATLNRPSDVPDFEEDGNITDPPRFVDPDVGNYRLSRDSPCINAGLNQDDWMHDAVDLDGNPRIDRVHNQVDMGAYEFQYAGTTILVR